MATTRVEQGFEPKGNQSRQSAHRVLIGTGSLAIILALISTTWRILVHKEDKPMGGQGSTEWCAAATRDTAVMSHGRRKECEFATVVPRGPSVVGDDVDGDLGPIREDVIRDIPSDVVNLTEWIHVDTETFGRSHDGTVQALMEQYNAEALRIAAIRFRGRITGAHLAPNGPEYHLAFVRNGFDVAMSYGRLSARGHQGCVVTSDAAWVNCYDLLPLATFDPKEFQSIDIMTIVQATGKPDRDETVEVYKLESQRMVLYIGQHDRRLRRICVRDDWNSKENARVDFRNYVQVGECWYPLRTQVRMWSEGRFFRQQESDVDLELIPTSIEVTPPSLRTTH